MRPTVCYGNEQPMVQGSEIEASVEAIRERREAGLSALALKRHLGVSYPTAWLVHHKLMQAMSEREDRYVLEGQVQLDDAYLGGERSGGKAGRGSENKVPFVAAVSLSDVGHPLRVKLTLVAGFTLKAIEDWALENLAPDATVSSDLPGPGRSP